MTGFRLFTLVLVVVVGAVGLVAVSVTLVGCEPIERTAPTTGTDEVADSSPGTVEVADSSPGIGEWIKKFERVDSREEPVALTAVPSDVRELELARRAERPVDSNRENLGLVYDRVSNGRNKNGPPRVKSAEPMPPTACKSVEPAPRHVDRNSGPHDIHDSAVYHFENSSGFGFMRMLYIKNERDVWVASKAIDRVELVSLLTESEPSVYVLDEMATPALARQAKRRPLDEFERHGLEAVRRGEHLVWTPEAPTRMFGAIRARTQCLECHANAKKGELLGAFTYYLTTPVDQLAKRDRK